MAEPKTREELMLELQDKLKGTQNPSYLQEIAIPGVATPVNTADSDK